MGKIRVKSFDELEQAAKDKKLQTKRADKKAEKNAKKAEENIPEDTQAEPQTQNQPQSEEASTPEGEVKQKNKGPKKQQKSGAPRERSEKYKVALMQVDVEKIYSVKEGLELLEKVHLAKFDETVELHINTLSVGVSGQMTLPHGSGKKTRVAIATDDLIAEVEKGNVNFDILVANPQMMPKLAKVAKVLGPRGLMPNPKNGTITANPEELVKKYEGGAMNFKTEAKSPIIHLIVGKMSFGADKLSENIEVAVTSVKRANIVNATLKSTMSPGIKVKV